MPGPVYQDAIIFLGVAIILTFALATVSISTWFTRRSLRKRLTLLADRLAPEATLTGRSQSFDATLARLDRAAEERVSGESQAGDVAHRLKLLLAEMPVGVVICDVNGALMHRNAVAAQLGLGGRGAQPGATDPAGTVLRAALNGKRSVRHIDAGGHDRIGPGLRLRLVGVPLGGESSGMGAAVVIEDRSDVAAHAPTPAGVAQPVIDAPVAVAPFAVEDVPPVDEPIEPPAPVTTIIPAGDEEMPLAAVLAAAVESVRERAQARLLVLDVDAETEVAVTAEAAALERAVTTALAHAAEVARAGATLSVSVDSAERVRILVSVSQCRRELNETSWYLDLTPALRPATPDRAHIALAS